MNDTNRAARSRQLACLADGQKPPAPRAALALARSKAYQSAADAPSTLRAYIRETLRGIARTHGEPARRSAALTTEEIKRLVATCGADLTGLRDHALLLLGFAGAPAGPNWSVLTSSTCPLPRSACGC